MPSAKTFALAIAVLTLPATAFASSPDAWAKFNEDMKQKCETATKAMFKRAEVVVDPTGSASYGLAIVYGKMKEEKGKGSAICVVDKKTGAVEVGTMLDKDMIRVAKPKPADSSKTSTDDDGDDDSAQ
jgi:hypothetical protein